MYPAAVLDDFRAAGRVALNRIYVRIINVIDDAGMTISVFRRPPEQDHASMLRLFVRGLCGKRWTVDEGEMS